MSPPNASSNVLLSDDDVTEVDSVRGHLACEVVRSTRAETELWSAVSRLADSYQTLCLQMEWFRRRQWIQLTIACVAPLFCWLLGAILFWSLSL